MQPLCRNQAISGDYIVKSRETRIVQFQIITIGSVCIIILGGMLSAYHMKKSMEKSNAEFQIGKNLSEALNYYANSLYKGSSLTII